MIILHKIDELAQDLFPELIGNDLNNQLIIEKIKDYYTYESHIPSVIIENGFIKIEIDTDAIINQQNEFQKAIKLCESNQFDKAISILQELISKNPTNSEYYRVLGQAHSMINKQDEAIDYLIDALKWNPKNNHALLMIGNIFTTSKNDLSTAKKYYNKVIENNPNDYVAITNLGTNLLQSGNMTEGLEYFEQSYAINKDYPNSIFGIALANEKLGNILISFEFGIECLKKCKPNDNVIKQHATSLVVRTATNYIKDFTGKQCFLLYKDLVEGLCNRPIQVVEDNEIKTDAKIEFAENYKRDYHLIKYKGNQAGIYHLMMHELAHLHFVMEARNEKVNMQFVSTKEQYVKFKSDFSKSVDNLVKSGIPDDSVEKFFNGIFNGLNLQLYNTPIDLFIEDRLFELYREMRPVQFLSLLQMNKTGAQAVTDKTAIKFSPAVVLHASKVLNIVNALHFKDLFGLDLLSDFNAAPAELKQAKDLFQEFFEYRDDKGYGEEYEIIEHWGNDLKLSNYFSLRKEINYDKPSTIGDAIDNLEKDPLGLFTDTELKDYESEKFQKAQEELGTNLAVAMFMVDAMQYFNDMPLLKVKEIALQIAMLGTQGISPDKQNYIVPAINDKTFSGYHLLAYYYISFKLAIPEMLGSLQLPFDNEYLLARQMFKP